MAVTFRESLVYFPFETVGVSVDLSGSILDLDHWKITTPICGEFILASLHTVCIKCLFQYWEA